MKIKKSDKFKSLAKFQISYLQVGRDVECNVPSVCSGKSSDFVEDIT